MDIEGIAAHWLWLTLGLVLAALEMLVPGVYLIWLAGAALVVGLVTLGMATIGATLPIAVQVIGFVALALIFVFTARRWLKEAPLGSPDPLLNRRGAQLEGQIVLVTQAIAQGRGRVHVGDSEWIAHGPDAAIGEAVRICGSEGAILLVERI